MSRVQELLLLQEEAFEGDPEHALLANLRRVRLEDWLLVPPGGGQSVRDIAAHVGAGKLAYENHAFGDGTLTWDGAVALAPAWEEGPGAADAVIAWLRLAQEQLFRSVRTLRDDQLSFQRRTPWGAYVETRRIISTLIKHDLYHAGEIGHIRAVRQGNDRWG